MTYDFKQESIKIAETLRLADEQTVTFLELCLRQAYVEGESNQLREALAKLEGEK